jgi:hypothetical protein
MSGTTTKKKTPANSTASQIEQILKSEGTGFATGGSTTSNIPGVTSKLAGDILPFTAPHQLPWFNPPSGTLSTDSAGGSTITYGNWVSLIHQIKDNPTLLDRIQRSMKQAGYLPTTWANYGNLDKATSSAWEAMGQAAIGGNESATALLNSGMTEGGLGTYMKGLQERYATAQANANAASSVNVSLTDPNDVAQRYATAMESMGMGAPSKEQTQQFVNAFINGPQGEIAAAQDQSQVQKHNELSAAGDMSTALQQAALGNISGAQAAENTVGQTYVATKAMPNLDAEAIAAAQKSNPGQYYATGSTYLYGLLQRMLNGDMTLPTSPQSPTSMTPAGGIVTSPIAGAP